MFLALRFPGSYYLNFYIRYFSDFWEHLTPERYGALMIFIGICGYLLMKSTR